MIPKRIHQIWLGPNPLPDEFKAYQETWLVHHPGWELRFWTESNLPDDLRRKEVYQKLRTPAERADILRLEVLWREGGFYVDTDFECLRSIEPLIDDLDFFAAYVKPGRVNNAFLGSIPGHPILDRALNELRPSEYWGYNKAAAGPVFLNRLLKEYPEVTIFDPGLFYPSNPADREMAVAHHHRARSWKGDGGFKQAALKAEERLWQAQDELLRTLTDLRDARRELAKYKAHGASVHGKKGRVRRAMLHVVTAWRVPKNTSARLQKRARWMKKWVRHLLVKRLWRGAYGLWNMRNRPAYRRRLDKIPARDEIPALLNIRRLTGQAAEIGVKAGKFSDLLLRKWKGGKLISIDPWLEDAPENYVDRANVVQAEQDNYYHMTKARLEKYGSRSEIWRMTSVESSRKIDSHSLDFVYIDARHDYESVLGDLEHWYDKVKPGGILAGHDYVDGQFEQGVFGVKRAVDEFFAKKSLRVYATEGRFPAEMFPSWIVEIPRDPCRSHQEEH